MLKKISPEVQLFLIGIIIIVIFFVSFPSFIICFGWIAGFLLPVFFPIVLRIGPGVGIAGLMYELLVDWKKRGPVGKILPIMAIIFGMLSYICSDLAE